MPASSGLRVHRPRVWSSLGSPHRLQEGLEILLDYNYDQLPIKYIKDLGKSVGF